VRDRLEIDVRTDPASVAAAAAERWIACASEAISARGLFAVALAGGSTPRALYGRLAESPWRERIDWGRTVVFFGDERCVPPDHPESNYRMAFETLLAKVPVPPDNVQRILGEAAEPNEAAVLYEAALRGAFPDDAVPRFDLILLGMGSDGHTASLFPGTRALDEKARWVVANWVPKLEAWRVTLTYPVIRAARRVLFLVTGRDKAPAFRRVFGPEDGGDPLPAARVVPIDGVVEVLADREAADAS